MILDNLKSRKRKGFTLMELVFSLILVAIAFATLIPIIKGNTTIRNVSYDLMNVNTVNTFCYDLMAKYKACDDVLVSNTDNSTSITLIGERAKNTTYTFLTGVDGGDLCELRENNMTLFTCKSFTVSANSQSLHMTLNVTGEEVIEYVIYK